MQAILEQNKLTETFVNEKTNAVAFGGRIGLLAQLFGCWHKEISRPFTIGNESYRACLHCGARKHFDTETLKTYGSFHYPPAVSVNEN